MQNYVKFGKCLMSNGSLAVTIQFAPFRSIIGRAAVLSLLAALTLVGHAQVHGGLRQKDAIDQSTEKDATPDNTNPLERTGEIQKVGEAVKELVVLKWSGKQLELNFPTDPQQASTQFDKIRQLSGFGGGGSSWGGDVFEFEASSPKLQTRMAREKRDGTSYQSIFSMQEKTSPNRRLDVVAHDDGYIQITIHDREMGYLLRVRQLANGQFSVQELNGTKVFATAGATFETVCRQEREFMESRLIPAISHFGFGTLITLYSEGVQKAVISLLGPWSDAEKHIVESLIADLDSESFAARQEASRRLQKAPAEDRLLLSRVINDARFSPEVRTRVRSLVRDNASSEELCQMEFMDQLVRRLDAPYLQELVKLQSDPANREILIGHLATIKNGEPIESTEGVDGTSAETTLPETVAAPPDLLAEQGTLQTVADETAALVHLTWNGDQISVDRDHWAAPFGGKQIKDLANEVQLAIEAARLPAAWFRPGGNFEIDSVLHPQVLFERLEVKVFKTNDNIHRNVYYGGQNVSLNREIKTTLLDGRLQFEENDNRQVNNGGNGKGNADSARSSPFLFTIAENTNSGRALTVHEPAQGELHILLTGEASNFVVQLTINKDRALVQDIRGETVQAFSAQNFRQLLEEHREYFAQSFFPLLRHLGISVDPSIVPLSETATEQTPVED